MSLKLIIKNQIVHQISKLQQVFKSLRFHEQVTAGEKDYVLVHGGLDHFTPKRPLSDYGLHELIFNSPDYSKEYFPDRYLVTGHTPTQFISENRTPGRIYRANNHIAIDCGASFGGNLGAICLETGEEFYT